MKNNLLNKFPLLSPLSFLLSPLSSQITVFTILILFGCCTGSQRENDPEGTNSCITMTNICDSVVMVGTGWDYVTAINTQQGIVVIDAGISYSLTSNYRELIEKRFKSDDFAWLINTHAHHDHTRGNPVFSDAVIVGHRSFLREILAIWKDTVRVLSWASASITYYQAQLDSLTKNSPEWKEALCNKNIYKHLLRDASGEPEYAVPELTFDDTLTLRAGNVTFCLLCFGKAHSTADVIIYVPEKKILFTGDLFSKYGKPNFNSGEKADAERWLRALNWIESRSDSIDIIISGHGAILSRDDLQSFLLFPDRTH
ncbi:MAG: MBL fold metallo-hydrolase [Bacteroidales bacterium]|nr:MBL fold metallo-hydrolase [Bacteroidales bacterium]